MYLPDVYLLNKKNSLPVRDEIKDRQIVLSLRDNKAKRNESVGQNRWAVRNRRKHHNGLCFYNAGLVFNSG